MEHLAQDFLLKINTYAKKYLFLVALFLKALALSVPH
jgi:hypothetical protein